MPEAGQSLALNTLIKRISNAVSAGTSDIDPTSVDVQGYSVVTFIFLFGALTDTAVTSCIIKGSNDNSTFANMTDDGSSTVSVTVADTDDNKMVIIELIKPRKRYLKAYVDRGTANAVLDGIIMIASNSRLVPVTADSTVISRLIAKNPI